MSIRSNKYNRTIFLFVIFMQTCFILKAQDKSNQDDNFFSISSGVSYFSIKENISDGSVRKRLIEGPSWVFDLKWGGKVADNFFLHLDLLTVSSLNVNITEDGKKLNNIPGDYSAMMIMIGTGITTYIRPGNFFVSESIGFGSFSETENGITTDSDGGIGLYAKLGKEWRLSGKWNLGICVWSEYIFATLNTDYYDEQFSGSAFGFSINVTKIWTKKRHLPVFGCGKY